ncbi:collagen-like protein [Marixanthomonas ophiurae]|uniref:Collagen-like protein n=1 Tax=Marixanthomonas ophiurae TaxID=387659 RepID=A0A3E1Q7E5_9FLAO|nr:collagen-like protein [Marixanthomonas ophiurae]RFN58063.1 collagen-like protein [Marixanthomonas ophiurae]
MKQILLFLALSTTFLFSSCEGDPGPAGPPGDDFLAQTFEVTTTLQLNTQNNLYQTDRIAYPFEVFESDAVLAYRLEDVDEDGFDVWTQLPNNFYLGNGEVIQYLHLQTFIDVQVIIDGDYDPQTLSTDFTDNETFRFVVVPAEFADAKMSMDEAIETFNIQL